MNVVGKVGSFITQGVYSVATPFHPFGGAVDIIVVQQQDGSYRSTPWYVRFGKFQGVLKGAEKVVRIEVNGTESNFHMYIDNSGEAYFVREVVPEKNGELNGDNNKSTEEGDRDDQDTDTSSQISRLESCDSGTGEFQIRDEHVALGVDRLERTDSDADKRFYDFTDVRSSFGSSAELSEYGSSRYDNLDMDHVIESENLSSEVVLVSVDGHILTAPISSLERNADDVELNTPQFNLSPGEGTEELISPISSLERNADVELNTPQFNLGPGEGTEELTSPISSLERNADDVELNTPQFHLGPGEGTEELTSPISSLERNADDVELNTPQFHIGRGEGTEELIDGENSWTADYLTSFDTSTDRVNSSDVSKTNYGNPEAQVSQGDGGCAGEVEENQDTEKQVTTKYLNSSLENTSPRMKKEDVFKSCLELSTLAMQVGNMSSCDVNYPEEISEVTDKSLDKSPSIDGTRDLKFTISGISDELSSSSSGIPSIVHLPDLQAPAESIEGNSVDVGASGSAGMIDDFNYTNGKVEKEVDTDSRQQSPTSEEEIVANDDVECQTATFSEGNESETRRGLEISLCRNLLHSGMGAAAAKEAFDRHRISEEEFKSSATSLVKNENLVVRIQGKYLPWDKAAPLILGMVAYGLEISVGSDDAISVGQEAAIKTGEDESGNSSTPSGRGWRLWPIPFRRVRTLEHTTSNSSNEEAFADSESGTPIRPLEAISSSPGGKDSPHRQLLRTNVPTSDQIASLNLKEGQNMVTFVSISRVLGAQKVEAHIYLWKWNARIVISDVDGTITKSDVLGQFMPLVGKDWTHSGIARLFSAIKENGYQLLFLSARAIVQAYLTKTFLFNLKQDGKTLPVGPVVISPDGLFPSLYREVIRRAPHEFKIACLEDIKSLFPPDYNPFYAGFGNRDTDELSYRKIGIPKGKIFIINPKGEVAINNRIDVKSYTSLHTLVHDMFPPTSLVEQEDYNAWNYWKMPLPDIDG